MNQATTSTLRFLLAEELWALIQVGQQEVFLFYQDAKGQIKVSAPIFRFINRQMIPGGPKVSQAHSTDNVIHVLLGPRITDLNESVLFKGAWLNFVQSLGREVTPFMPGPFYIDALGRPFVKPRQVIPKTPANIGLDHRKYHITHLRLKSNAASTPEESAWINDFIGFKPKPGVEPVKEVAPPGGITMAYVLDQVDDENVRAHVSLAVCSKDDLYDRRVGAKMAVEKLEAYLASVAAGQPSEFTVLRDNGHLLFRGVFSSELEIGADKLVAMREPVVGVAKPVELKAPFRPVGPKLHQELLDTAYTLLGQAIYDVEDDLSQPVVGTPKQTARATDIFTLIYYTEKCISVEG